jgi:hypothetical protein
MLGDALLREDTWKRWVWFDDSARQRPVQDRMDLARDHRRRHPRLWPHRYDGATTSSGSPYLRAIGVASIGMGLFGLLITTFAYRRRERWAWFALWYYPVFGTAHLVGGLPPGKEHIHQIVFIVLSLASLLLSVGEFFPRRGARGNSRKRS